MDKSDKYLISSYVIKKSGPRKDPKFYKEISLFWKTNRECCIEIINTLPNIGYYKDFFYILEYCDDTELEEYIYDRILKLINRWKYGKNIILSKWIPREKSSFDRKYDFVNKISEKLFPEEANLNLRKKKYRLLVSSTCSKINTFESNLCAKTYGNIKDFTENNLKTYQGVIMKNKDLRKRVSEILKSRYENFTLKKLLKEREKKNLNKLRRTLLKPYILEKTKNIGTPSSTLIILNLDSNIYNNHIGYIIEKLKAYSRNHVEFIINGVVPKKYTFDKSIELTVKENVDSNPKLNLEEINKIVKKEYNEYLVFSTNKLEHDEKYKNEISWNFFKEKKFQRRDVYDLEDILKKYQKKSWIEKSLEWWNKMFK